ncbi:hypothetical protein LYNGBM3L_33450 [Moorena producens 3L]|uniref:Uncharacterized protein n=1 Tax=Moorena producens 3L TaxID=489825 RepID=F4XUE6_9CYAN|nr:hypothetical protein LYNGBM3L_33450 [Moorena producens 3L]OLT63791.1 hypothetical protein BI334_01030 [Moorena producens 3L]
MLKTIEAIVSNCLELSRIVFVFDSQSNPCLLILMQSLMGETPSFWPWCIAFRLVVMPTYLLTLFVILNNPVKPMKNVFKSVASHLI